MAANHLVVNGGSYIVNRKLAAFLRDLRVEDDLKQQIAEFITQFAWPAFARIFDGFKRLIRLLEKHRSERSVGLFAIPRAAVCRAQAIHEGDQISECSRHACSLKFMV